MLPLCDPVLHRPGTDILPPFTPWLRLWRAYWACKLRVMVSFCIRANTHFVAGHINLSTECAGRHSMAVSVSYAAGASTSINNLQAQLVIAPSSAASHQSLHACQKPQIKYLVFSEERMLRLTWGWCRSSEWYKWLQSRWLCTALGLADIARELACTGQNSCMQGLVQQIARA